MNIKQVENILKQAGIEPNEAKVEAKMFLQHFCGLSDTDLALNSEFEGREDLRQAVNLRAQKRIPIQHIIGKADFMGEKFIVSEHVLIPREETEILVRKAIELLNEKPSLKKVLDIGTGSGCIACMTAKLACAQVLGVDISSEALQIALDNAAKLNLFNKAVFRKSDIFSNIGLDEKFDVIVSNPPYIPLREKDSLQKEVGFEPEAALFAQDDDGIEFYRKIISQAGNFLNKGGYLMFELGMGQADKVKELMVKKGFKNIEIEKDLSYIDRVILGIWSDK